MLRAAAVTAVRGVSFNFLHSLLGSMPVRLLVVLRATCGAENEQ